MRENQTVVQVWGGPFDGEVYALHGRPPVLYLAESHIPLTNEVVIAGRFDDPNFTIWELPIKLDAYGTNYPLKAWWDERQRYQ